MRASRVVRVVIPVCVVLAVVVVAVAVLTARPDQQHAQRNVNAAWTPLAGDLDQRYLVLVAADDRVRGLSGPVRELADSVHTALARWQDAEKGKDVDVQVRAANDLEALSRRLVGAAHASERVRSDAGAARAVDAFASTPAPGDKIAAYNAAVRTYAHERRGPVRGIVSTLLGNDDIPAFEPATA